MQEAKAMKYLWKYIHLLWDIADRNWLQNKWKNWTFNTSMTFRFKHDYAYNNLFTKHIEEVFILNERKKCLKWKTANRQRCFVFVLLIPLSLGCVVV